MVAAKIIHSMFLLLLLLLLLLFLLALCIWNEA
jgi:hypothetical protein